MAGVRFGKKLNENRIVVAHVVARNLAYVLFVDDEQKDFDYLYEALAPLFPSVFRVDDSGDELLERVARMDGHEHPVEMIKLKESFDEKSMESKNGAPYTKEMLTALFGGIL